MNNTKQKASAGAFDRVLFYFGAAGGPFLFAGEKVCLTPYPVPVRLRRSAG